MYKIENVFFCGRSKSSSVGNCCRQVKLLPGNKKCASSKQKPNWCNKRKRDETRRIRPLLKWQTSFYNTMTVLKTPPCRISSRWRHKEPRQTRVTEQKLHATKWMSGLVDPNSYHVSKQPPWLCAALKKDNVVHLKTSFQCKVLLMCTIIVFVLRRFEVSSPFFFLTLLVCSHLHFLLPPAPDSLCWRVRSEKRERGRLMKTTHTHPGLRFSTAAHITTNPMKQIIKKNAFKSGLILTWQHKRNLTEECGRQWKQSGF